MIDENALGTPVEDGCILDDWFESANSFTAGAYRQNTFYMRMESVFDLDVNTEDLASSALAMHAHEYVHFLHNASTTSGQAYLVANLVLLRALSSGCDERGYFLGHESMSDEHREHLRLVGMLMNAQLGTTAVPSLNTCTDYSKWDCSGAELCTNGDIRRVETVFTAENAKGEVLTQRVVIGLSFVTEGIAYEVDREIRRLSGAKEDQLDAHAKVFPYRAYRRLIERWSGRKLTAQERIGIGVTALTSSFSGAALAQICAELKKTEHRVFEVLTKAREIFRPEAEIVLSQIRQQRIDLSKGDTIWTAMGEYMRLAEAGVRLRRKRWAPEMLFLSSRLTTEKLRSRFGSMLDCLVIQEKPERKLDIYWIGPGHIAQTFETSQCLGALQSAMHFSHLHLSSEGVAHTTAQFAGRKVTCPFSGGCGAEIDDGFPEACKSSPWERFVSASPGEKVCWYAAGVKAIGNRRNRNEHDQISKETGG